ncbi:MAG TPA: glycine cleavage system protein H [Anaeromyxobacteraceae bacterium]|nr:glycine cleavage system protein H [Anaeromyxobacteraceae bacterium]
MSAIIGILEYAATLIGGIAARIGVVLLAMAAFAVPALLVWGGLRAVEWARRRAQGLELAGGLRFRPGLRYVPGHTWLRAEKGEVRVGVDDLVQRLLPWAVSVRLPKPGAALRAGEPAAVISAGDREAVIAAPVDGTVTGVNGNVVREPSLVKSDGYARGWLFRMAPASDGLPGKAEAEGKAWLAAEGERLNRWLEPRLGFAAADGGTLADPVASHLSAEEWRSLTDAFLRR